MEPVIDAVCGFMFSMDGQHVVLIQKNRPAFQAGKLNGVGGKVEDADHGRPTLAMTREFSEETGVRTMASDWEEFAVIETPRWHVRMYRAFSDAASQVQSVTDEPVVVVPVYRLWQWDTLRNVQWLVPMALDTSPYVLPITVKEMA